MSTSRKPSILAEMPPRSVSIILLTLLALLGLFLFFRMPPVGVFPGNVSVAVTGFETNTAGAVLALVPISNRGGQPLRVAVGTQVYKDIGWVDSVSGLANGPNLTLQPGTLENGHSTIIRVPVPKQKPWRVAVLCQKTYPTGWSRDLLRTADVLILKRQIAAYFYSSPVE